MNFRPAHKIFVKYVAGSLTVIYQHIPILIYAELQEQAHHEDLYAFHNVSTVYLTNIYGSETCEKQTLQSKTEHIICVEYKILGSSVTTAIAVEACANTVVMFLDVR
jgi:hypothetical protein